jgi:uncharacterized phage protein (TIGR02218 family)
MARTIPSQLLTHLESRVTTTALLLKIIPKRDGVATLGFANIDQDLLYDMGNGDGALLYYAHQGLDLSALQSFADASVDNAEGAGLYPEDGGTGLTELAVRSGDYAFAGYVAMLVNYNDLTAGRHTIIDTGSLGEMYSEDDAEFRLELRSLADKLRASIVSLTSVTCRCVFGSQPSETNEYCGVDAEALFITVTVDSPLTEARFGFQSNALTQANGYFRQGLVRFETGANAGREVEVEDSWSDGNVTFRFPADRPVEVGDQLKIRIGCRKRFLEDCRRNFRGEPYMPIADVDAMLVPGVGSGSGGFSNIVQAVVSTEGA